MGEGVETHKIEGYLSQKIMSYSINLAISPKRTIFLSRHGESTFNQENRIGGNPGLSEAGTKYASKLPKVFEDENVLEDKDKTTILTSTLKRTIRTAEYLKLNEKAPIQLKVLDELNAGTCEELTYA